MNLVDIGGEVQWEDIMLGWMELVIMMDQWGETKTIIIMIILQLQLQLPLVLMKKEHLIHTKVYKMLLLE